MEVCGFIYSCRVVKTVEQTTGFQTLPEDLLHYQDIRGLEKHDLGLVG